MITSMSARVHGSAAAVQAAALWSRWHWQGAAKAGLWRGMAWPKVRCRGGARVVARVRKYEICA